MLLANVPLPSLPPPLSLSLCVKHFRVGSCRTCTPGPIQHFGATSRNECRRLYITQSAAINARWRYCYRMLASCVLKLPKIFLVEGYESFFSFGKQLRFIAVVKIATRANEKRISIVSVARFYKHTNLRYTRKFSGPYSTQDITTFSRFQKWNGLSNIRISILYKLVKFYETSPVRWQIYYRYPDDQH